MPSELPPASQSSPACPACGYLRAGIASDARCPECGAEGFDGVATLSGTPRTLALSNTYATDRVTSRGAGFQPDIIERPGLRLDFVAREGFKVFGREGELSFEARNLLRVQYKEFQQNGDNIIYYNKYRMGTTFELGLTFKF